MTSRDAIGRTALHVVAEQEDDGPPTDALLELIAELAEHENVANAEDYLGRTPLMSLVDAGPNGLPIARVLLDNGASLLAEDKEGRTWVDYMTRCIDDAGVDGGKIGLGNSYLEFFMELVQEMGYELARKGQTILSWRSVYGENLLHAVIGEFAGENIIEFVLGLGFNINAIDGAGRTALYQALYASQYTVIELLLQNGASLTTPDEDGITPLDVAHATLDDDKFERLHDWHVNGRNFATFRF
jgi:ankyrin repeat protein